MDDGLAHLRDGVTNDLNRLTQVGAPQLDMTISRQVAVYWQELLATYRRGISKTFVPTVFNDRIELQGDLELIHVPQLVGLIEAFGSDVYETSMVPGGDQMARKVWSCLFKPQNVFGLMKSAGYDVDDAPRFYQSPNMLDSLEKPRWFHMLQELYIEARPKDDQHYLVTLAFNPCHFVADIDQRKYEPLYMFVNEMVLPLLTGVRLHRVDFNYDFLANPEQLSVSTKNEDVHKETIRNTHDAIVVEAGTRAAYYLYMKSVETMHDQWGHGYLNTAEMALLHEKTGTALSRIELRLNEAGIMDIMHSARVPSFDSRFFPSWLTFDYRFMHNGHTQHRSMRLLLGRVHDQSFKILKRQPFVTDELLRNTVIAAMAELHDAHEPYDI
ncbi:hypothetical protein [Secundilactobacillus collinoides]|uniref:Uncharacterized protein n=2 Tax=Secundilactobacillus collinoides TaxID=33960 RepID=A0A0R2B5P9_SECCO|nr:hypothetical protein [Secundilactobacillus collinoides]KRM74410.1 hypothetical protein FC82_GL000168 [Secundilactobacillus collinoides DSM 20515 = JCM 1123]KZL39752.1 hypothetical protein TY91_09750 [Secundilactobacillus collinoides]